MPLRACDIQGCPKPVPRKHGGCFICARNLCMAHMMSGDHLCPAEETDPVVYRKEYEAAQRQRLLDTLQKLDVPALTTLASSLRNGMACSVPALELEQEERLNILSRNMTAEEFHIDIMFEDGVEWDAKIQCNHGALPPSPVQEYVFLSEASTLKFLKRTNVPAPQIYSYYWKDSPDNHVGVSFMLLEKLPGRRLQWATLPWEERTKIIEQLADIALELEKFSFNMTGSIAHSDSTDVSIKGFAQIPLFRDADRPIGPFSSLHASLKAIMHLQLDIITDGEFPSLPVDHFLSYLWRLQTIPDIIASTNSGEGGPFYLKHPNEDGNHIMVDEDNNITGIVDWSNASVQSKNHAFSSPHMLWCKDAFNRGENDLSEEESEYAKTFERRGRDDIAELVRTGRKLQRFLFHLGGSWTKDQQTFETLFRGLRIACVIPGDGAGMEEANEPYESWKAKAIEKYKVEYPQLQGLIDAETARANENNTVLSGNSTRL